jgi:hypothetical protein
MSGRVTWCARKTPKRLIQVRRKSLSQGCGGDSSFAATVIGMNKNCARPSLRHEQSKVNEQFHVGK